LNGGGEQRLIGPSFIVSWRRTMTYGVITRIPAPIEAYDALRVEMEKVLGSLEPDGLVLHVARAADGGFELVEVWDSKQHSDTFNNDAVRPALVRLGVGMSADGPVPEILEFDPSRIIIPHRS
jgi:hypothetical protein